MSYEVSVVANYHKGEAFPFQLLIFLFTHNYLNTRVGLTLYLLATKIIDYLDIMEDKEFK